MYNSFLKVNMIIFSTLFLNYLNRSRGHWRKDPLSFTAFTNGVTFGDSTTLCEN